MNAIDPVGRLRLALVDQVVALERLATRAELVRALVPREPGSKWSGPASLAYSLALRSVRSDIVQASDRVAEALTESRRSLAAVNSRV